MDPIKRKNPFAEADGTSGPSSSPDKRVQQINHHAGTMGSSLVPPQPPSRARSVSPFRRRIGASVHTSKGLKNTNKTSPNSTAIAPPATTVSQLPLAPSRSPSAALLNVPSGIAAVASVTLNNQSIGTCSTGHPSTAPEPPNEPPPGSLLASIYDTITSLRTAQSNKEKRRWRYTNRNGEEVLVVNVLGQILKSMERYAQIIDVAIQHHPDITALVWSGVKFILLVAIERIQLMESLEFTLATIVGKMASCEFYGAIYRNRLSVNLGSTTTTQAMTQRLKGALNDMYEAIQDFTLQAKEYFGDAQLPISIKIKNLFTPFAVKMKPSLEAIADKEKIVRELADMATMERVMENSQNITVIQNIVEEIRNELKPSGNFPGTDILRATVENLSLTEEALVITREVQAKLDHVQVQVVKALQPHQQALLSSTSLDPELQQLKHKYLSESTETDIYDPDLYIPAQGMVRPNAPESEHFDLAQRVEEFLSPGASEKVCLIQGTGGSGKSTFNHYLARQMWDAYDKCSSEQQATMAIPIFITLANIHDSTRHNKDLIAQLFQNLGWNEQMIKQAREELHFVFILDGYDEIEKRDRNIYVDSRLFTWNAKTIITSRPEYLGPGYQNNFHPPGHLRLLKEYWVAPFSTDSIRRYIEKYVGAMNAQALLGSRLHTVHEYEELLSHPDLRVLISNPFLLRMVMSVQPRATGSEVLFQRVSLYGQFIQHWFQGAQVRLSRVQLPKPLSDIFIALCEEDFVQHVHSYCQRFAMALYQNKSLEGTYNPKFPSHTPNERGSHGQLPGNSVWETFLTTANPQTRLLRFSAPLLRLGQSYRFLHKSLRDYLVAESLWEDNRLGTNEALLNQFCIIDDPGVLDFIQEQAQRSQKVTEGLLACIELSKYSATMAQAAANAITILVKAGKQFTRHDLRGIRIPGADISHGWFDGAQLMESDLQNVRLQGSWLRGADMTNSRMDGVFYGEKPSWRRCDSQDPAQSGSGSICFSSSEQLLFLCGILGSSRVQLWSLTKEELILDVSVLNTWSTAVDCTAISQDGTLFAGAYWGFNWGLGGISIGRSNVITVWSIALKCQLFLANGVCDQHCSILCLAFSPDNTILASGCSRGRICLFSSTQGTLLHQLNDHTESVKCITFSSDGDFLFSAADNVRVWSLPDGTLDDVLEHGAAKVRSLACVSAKQLVALGCMDGNIKIWSTRPHQRLVQIINTQTPDKGAGAIVTFSSDGRMLVGGLSNGRIKLWSTEDWTLIASVAGLGTSSACTHIVFSPDEQVMAVAFDDTTVRMIVTSHLNQPTSRISNVSPTRYVGSGRVTSVSWSPDGKQLAAGTTSETTIRLLSLVGGHTVRCFEGHSNWITSVAFSPDGQLLASASYNNDVRLWSVPDQHVHRLKLHTDSAGSIAFSPDSKLVALGSYDKTIHLRSVPDDHSVRCFEGHTRWVTCVAFAPNGQLLASGSSDETVRVWSVDKSDSVYCYRGHTGWVTSIAFSPGGELLASGGTDFTVRVWSVSENPEIHCLRGHENRVSCVMFSPYGELLASGSHDNTIRLWAVHSKIFIASIQIGFPVEVIDWTKAAGFKEGGYLAVGTDPVIVQVWRIVNQAIHSSENVSLDISCEWATNQGILNLREAKIDGVRGLERVNVRLLKQHGAIGDPADSHMMEM